MNRSDAEARIRQSVTSTYPRQDRAMFVAEIIRTWGDFRWVGVYDVGHENVSVIAWSGPGAPEYPTFPISKGLTGQALREKRTVVVGDVRNDPNYLIAFGTTLSEIIIPVLDAQERQVLGTIDVESEKLNAFSQADREALEGFARAAAPLWTGKRS